MDWAKVLSLDYLTPESAGMYFGDYAEAFTSTRIPYTGLIIINNKWKIKTK